MKRKKNTTNTPIASFKKIWYDEIT